MATPTAPQLNIRSAFARERAAALARATGMSTTRVIEEALRAYVPPMTAPVGGNLLSKGPLLVHKATGRPIAHAEAELALEQIRQGRA
jgi:hypothetical protein